MTRGKRGQAVTTRRAHEAVESQIEMYRRHVKQLTEENRELKAKLKTEQAGRRQDIRALKAQINEGLSPELIALRRKLDEQAERAAAAEARSRRIQEKWDRITGNFQRSLVATFGITPMEAMEFGVNTLFREDDDPIEGMFIVSDDFKGKKKRRFSGNATARIEAARGNRRSLNPLGTLGDES